MTSRRSLRRRSSGSRAIGAAAASVCRRGAFIAGLTAALIALAAGHAALARGEETPLEETQKGVTIDWHAGTLSATGGAAADTRMPTVDVARPGAVRRATAAAAAKLSAALASLPLGGGRKLTAEEVARAASRVRAVDVQYQSNGGAIVRAEVRFGDWLEPAPSGGPVATLVVPAMRLAAAPAAKVGARELRVGAAVYRIGAAPPDAGAVAARVDAAGRVALTGEAASGDKLARGLAVIYVQKVLR